MKKETTYFFALCCALTLFFGCAAPMSVNMVKHQGRYIPTENANKGLIYIYRESAYGASLRGIYVTADGKRVGALNSGTYFVYEANPGSVVISVENWMSKEDPSRTIKVEAGKSYYIQGGFKSGFWDIQPTLMIMNEAEGEGAIQPLKYETLEKSEGQDQASTKK